MADATKLTVTTDPKTGQIIQNDTGQIPVGQADIGLKLENISTPNVSVIDLPQEDIGDVSIVNKDGKKITSPETQAQQNIQGAAQQAKSTPTQATPTQTQATPTPTEPKTKTNREDVLANFQKYMGRKPETEEDLKNVEFMTTLPPEEVERRLKESGKQAQLDTIAQKEKEELDDKTKKDVEAKAGFEAMDRVAAERKLAEQEKKEQDTETEKSYLDMIMDIRNSNSEELEAKKAELEKAKITMDDANQSLIDSIEATFDRRITQQEQVNKALLAGERIRGFTSGRARFANTMQANIISAEESAGIARVADIETQKQAALTEAKLAIASDDYERLNNEVNAFQEAQDAQVAELIQLNKMANENERLTLSKMAEARQATLLGLSIEDAQRKEAVFMAGQEDRIAKNLASISVGLDENGNIQEPSEEEIIMLSEQEGISPGILMAQIREKTMELEKIQTDKRKDYLNELQTMANIDRTQFLTEKDKALLPFTIKEKQLSIDNKILDGIKKQVSISGGGGGNSLDDLKPEDFGISSVEVLRDIQETVNVLRAGGIEYGDIPDEIRGFINVEPDPYDPDTVTYKMNEPTENQYKTIVQRRFDNVKASYENEQAIVADLRNDSSLDNQKAIIIDLMEYNDMSNSDANKYLQEIAKSNNLAL